MVGGGWWYGSKRVARAQESQGERLDGEVRLRDSDSDVQINKSRKVAGDRVDVDKSNKRLAPGQQTQQLLGFPSKIKYGRVMEED